MKKNLLTFAVMLMAAFGTLCAQHVVYYSQDFQGDSKPSELLYYDADGNKLHDDLVGTGLECGTWHLIKMSVTDSNKLMGSASMFTTPGKANDWMVTPQIKIYGSGAKLSWKSMSATRTKKDGLKVYISTKGYSIEDFEAEPIFSIEEEEAATLQSHEVSLDKYAGQAIYIAFVNDSYDKYVLCVDDIQVSGPAATEAQDRAVFQVTTPLMTDTGKAKMSLNVENVKAATLDALTVCFRANGQVYNQSFTGLNLAKNKVASLTLDQEVDVPLNTTLVYDMWVEVDGDCSLSARDSIRGSYFVSNRRTLIEEGTGTWCGNCPGGAVALQYMEEHYPDNVVGIAVHGDNATDPMYFPDYINFCEYPAYPMMLVDRKYLGLPAELDDDYNYSFMAPGSGVEYFFSMAQRFLAEAELSGTAHLVDSKANRLEVKVDSRFINDVKSSGYDIALILLEDSVTAPDGTLYKQQNYYASTNHTFVGLKDTITGSGGWGKLPGTAPMKFNHVARAAYNGSFNGYGNTNGLPANIKGGQVYTSTYTWDVPAGTVNHMKNASVVALMTDATGYIVNCCKMHVNVETDAIQQIEDMAQASITAIHTIDGVQIPQLQSGVNIVTYTDSHGNTFTRKVVK
ncbi:MAG: choice-of-anchor J domain-containing protein [Bacteroidaceae bacterium]|nr:choice-of-anchor J domain-containing protein [Bacteroidaceae bacterium]